MCNPMATPLRPTEGRSNIELVDPDGSARTHLVQDDLSRLGEDPHSSADGDSIIFTSDSGGDGVFASA